jgi:hypothetical protein
MKKSLSILALLVCVPFLFGMAQQPPAENPTQEAAGVFVPDSIVDDFEDGNYNRLPEWWKFDNVNLKIKKNTHARGESIIEAETENYSLIVTGDAKDWYIGGIGTYLGRDASPYNTFQIDINAEKSKAGTIRFEFYDDDKGSWESAFDEKWVPKKDDLWIYELKVDWSGWKRLVIPFSDLKLSDPGRGNGIWDPDQKNGSGGLLQFQMIFNSDKKDGKINYTIDNIKLIKR